MSMSIRDLFENGKRPNLLFIITDQERHLQHWPADFANKHLPSLKQLQQTGITFQHAFTNACMCSPSRATFVTSQYPSLTGVTTTGSPQPKFSLPIDSVTLAHVVKQAGYGKIEWQGKWHLGNTPQDYGFTGWDPPDAGNYLTLNDTLGGGIPANDARFLDNILNFIERQSTQQQQEEEPWCLVASFVNPHDVYVAQHHHHMEEAGYNKEDLNRIQVPLPHNCREDLSENAKPRAHARMTWHSEYNDTSMQEYVNFYAHLHTLVDAQILQVLEKLHSTRQRDTTVIFRFADHGEQALSHGLVEKFYNVYEESIHIPLIVSNPKLQASGQETNSLASLLDILPTVADLLGVSNAFETCFYGTSLVEVLENPRTCPNEVVHFTYDDIPSRNAPSKIRCIRTLGYKYAVYFTPDGKDADWELYDLKVDPEENHNVAGQSRYDEIQLELDTKLQNVMQEMKTLPGEFAWPPKATPKSRGGPPMIRNSIKLVE
jgi:arylsulfatase A-like enzyme